MFGMAESCHAKIDRPLVKRARRTVAQAHVIGYLRVVLLAAPTTTQLERLIEETELLDE